MGRTGFLTLSAALFLGAVWSSPLHAQSVKPTYEGDPSVYKKIFEDQNFRVILANRKAGLHDKEHAHPGPGIVFNITDCKTKIYEPDGKTRDSEVKAGTASAVPVIPSHSAENVGSAECQQLFVERK